MDSLDELARVPTEDAAGGWEERHWEWLDGMRRLAGILDARGFEGRGVTVISTAERYDGILEHRLTVRFAAGDWFPKGAIERNVELVRKAFGMETAGLEPSESNPAIYHLVLSTG